MSDLEKAAAEGVAVAIKDLCRDFTSNLVNLGRKQLDRLSVDLETAFRKYLERSVRRISKIKTLLTPNTPVNLENSYVPVSLVRGNEHERILLNEDEFLNDIRSATCVVITGVGGCGKSVFLKHLFMRLYNEARGRIPLYIELRSVPPGTPLKKYLAAQISAVSPEFGSDLFDYALQKGKFVFLLDAMDEVDPERRDDLAKELLDLTYAYGDNSYVVTSRPDIQFSSWQEFEVVRVDELSKKQVKELIKKVKWNSDLKKAFVKAVDNGLYASHKAFLSNPLLCTIMLLTFGEGADIPSKMHIFFGRAFEVLFYRHDAMKEIGYRRKLKTKLGNDEFKRLAATFSTFTYLDHGSAFSPEAARQSADKAIQLDNLSVRSDDFITDFSQAVSILLDESDRFSFIHRTFQEYFVAAFLSERSFDEWAQLIDRILEGRSSDSVVPLLIDMNKERFDRDFLTKKIKGLREILDGINIESEPSKAFMLFFSGFSISTESKRVYSWILGDGNHLPQYWCMLRVIHWRYGFQFYQQASEAFDWESRAKKYARTPSKGGELEFRNVTDDTICGTPIQEALHALKRKVSEAEIQLRASAETQGRLLSGLVPSTAMIAKSGSSHSKSARPVASPRRRASGKKGKR